MQVSINVVIPSGAESIAVTFHSPGTSIRRAMKRPMVEVVLPLMLESTFKGCSRKCMAVLKSATIFPDFQGAYEHCQEGLTGHPIMFSEKWAVDITEAGFHCLFFTPLGGAKPPLESFDSLFRALPHRPVDSDQWRT